MNYKTEKLAYILILPLFLLLNTNTVLSQQAGTVIGVITSQNSGHPIEGVNVIFEEMRLGTTTASDGSFTFSQIQPGNYKLQVSFIGYQDVTREIIVESGSTTQVEIALHTRSAEMQEIVVEGRAINLVGVAESASQGRVGITELSTRPLLRTGEVMETVPGLIATQHSGSGKANQFYLRGFNLDHGTDFAASLEGTPLNLPTHGHGQGYLDLNFLIPEMINKVEFRKGPYYAEVGNFATSGNANINLVNQLDTPILKGEIGMDQYYRGLIANSSTVNNGKAEVLYGLNTLYYDGPFNVPENAAQFSGILKYSEGTAANGYSVTALGYTNAWNSSDQIPGDAVDSGRISRFGTIDSTDGGKTDRYMLIGNWWKSNQKHAQTRATVYASSYKLNLFSNFTYFLNPARGDQFEQVDRRLYGGARFSHQWFAEWFGRRNSNRIGADLRHDQIFEVGLYSTEDRQRWATVRDDQVGESSLAIYFDNDIQWNKKLKTIIGLRGDLFHFDVNSNIETNSGTKTDFIASPKFNLVLGPWNNTEYYLNLGLGYHSNDARGTTIQTDPVTGNPIDQVVPLARSRGVEIGARTAAIDGLQTSLTFFYLGLDSELIFVGDAGGTEASDASEHYGIEWVNYYRPIDWLKLNLDIALTKSQFTEAVSNDNEIPNSIGRIITGGVTADLPSGWLGSLRLRHFGPRPLTESGDIKSEATTLLNFKTGYDFAAFRLEIVMLNVLNVADSDISYYYTSRLRGEPPEGTTKVHFHPVIPRTFRASIMWKL